MLTDTDRRCHNLAFDAMAHAQELDCHTSWGTRLEREFIIRGHAKAIIALRAADLAQGAQDVQP